MNKMILAVILSLPVAASAQGFANDDFTCYSWEGGHKSAGSFTKCNRWVMPPEKVAPPVVLPPMPMAAPISCAPPPKVATVKRKKRVIPKCTPA
jgi:hypothetical protein